MCAKRKLSTELVKSTTVRTGLGIYDELRTLRPHLYQNAPSEGLELTVKYADTANETDQHFDKVIVAVHGCPGYYTNFDRLIQHFRHTNVRVIVPNLPDFSHTRSSGHVFWHSTAEKVQFLKDFLSQLGITKIDCLVSHSFGIQTIASLWENPGNIEIKGIALFAPQPFWDSKKEEKKKIRTIFAFKSELWYNFLSLTRVHKLPSMPMRFDNINEFLIICTTVLDDRSPIDLHRRIESLVNSTNIPITIMYGSKESLISKSAIQKLNEKFGIRPEDVIHLDEEKHTATDVIGGNRINSYVIKNGGHFVHANYHQFSNKVIENILDHHNN